MSEQDQRESFQDQGRSNDSNHNIRSRSRSPSNNNGYQDNQDDREVGSVHVSNLSPKTTSESLRTAFQQICRVSSCTVIMEPKTDISRCFGFVGFPTEEDVTKAVEHSGSILIDNNEIVIVRSRRVSGYAKTPGRYLGKAYERPGEGGYRGHGRGERVFRLGRGEPKSTTF